MNKGVPSHRAPPPGNSGVPAPRAAAVLRSEDLFRGAPEVRVVHADVEYRLRITRQGKLILTK